MPEPLLVHGRTPDDVLRCLEILQNKLEQEGSYVRANTAWLAGEAIKALLERIEENPT